MLLSKTILALAALLAFDMANTAIGTYIRFLRLDGTYAGYAFQNFHAGETRVYNGTQHVFAGFGFSGTSVDLQGSNIKAQLVFAVNNLSLSLMQQAADDRWIVDIRTVWLDPETFEESITYTNDTYQVVGYQHDGSRLGLDLGSPLDAVANQAPKRTLTQYLVGSLPSTGQISFV